MCLCKQRAFYALHCANIPTNIFKKIICPKCELPHLEDSSGYIKCYLLDDILLTGSEDVSTWKLAFHGASVDVILSIIRHGEFLMEGDVMNDGSYLTARHGKRKDHAIWTYPTREGADNRTILACFDNDETRLKVLLQVRQRPNSFKESETRWGHKIWSTNRRGAIYIESIQVCVIASKSALDIVPILRSQRVFYPSMDSQLFVCPVQKENYDFLRTLNIPASMFNPLLNICYCKNCWSATRKNSVLIAGEKFVIPRGWSQFGLAVNPVFSAVNDIWDSWNVGFHGCNSLHVVPILKHRTLLIPHDYLSDGTELGVNSSADEDQKCYFLSPTIEYAAHPWYAKYEKFKSKLAQVAIVFRVRPGSFDKQQETEGGTMKMFDDYTEIAEDEIEWYSSRRGCVHPYGVLVRTMTKDEAKEIAKKCGYKIDV